MAIRERSYANFTTYVDFDMSARLYEEEREKDAVYAVYLKKIRYNSQATTGGISLFRYYDDPDEGPSDKIAHLQWETVKERVIRAGTLEKLTNSLLNPEGELDTRQFNVFFTTYRAFATQLEVLNLIEDRYRQLKGSQDRTLEVLLNGIRSVLVNWIDLFADDFYDPPKYAALQSLVEFARGQLPHLQDVLVRAVNLVQKFKSEELSKSGKRDLLKKFCLGSTIDQSDLELVNVGRLHDISHISAKYVAEQLTYYDAEIFKRVITHQCLGCLWSRRHKVSAEQVYSVRATIDQFNAVSQRVMSTVLKPGLSHTSRASVMSKWIEIIHELRLLKNYSSLKSILSGLSSECVYRLKSIWCFVDKEKLDVFEENSKIFSEENNSSGARELLEKEGTAKSVLTVETPEKRGKKYKRSKSDVAEMHGTVPYLGTFLTDLTYIDSAFPDRLESGDLLNFEKRRKEFELIAHIKLLQSAAQSYRILPDPRFRVWFARLPCVSDEVCYDLSLKIQPPSQSTPIPDRKEEKSNKRRSWFDSISSIFASLEPNEDLKKSTSPPRQHHIRSHSTSGLVEYGVNRSVPIASMMLTVPNGRQTTDGRWPNTVRAQKRTQRQHSGPRQMVKSQTVAGGQFPGANGLTPEFPPPPWRLRPETLSYYYGNGHMVDSNYGRKPGPLRGHHHSRNKSSVSSNSGSSLEDQFRKSFCIGEPNGHNYNDPNERLMQMSPIPWYNLGYQQQQQQQESLQPYQTYSNGSPKMGRQELSIYYTPEDSDSNSRLSGNGNEPRLTARHRSTSDQSIVSLMATAEKQKSNGHLTNGQLKKPAMDKPELDCYIVRVSLDIPLQKIYNSTTMYKCIKIDNSDRTPHVIQKVIEKLTIVGNTEDFCIAQVLPDGDQLVLPDKENAFYALEQHPNMHILLKSRLDVPPSTVKIKKKRRVRSNLLRWSSGFL